MLVLEYIAWLSSLINDSMTLFITGSCGAHSRKTTLLNIFFIQGSLSFQIFSKLKCLTHFHSLQFGHLAFSTESANYAAILNIGYTF